MTDTKSRFVAKTAPSEGGCLEWQSTIHRDGYGKFWHAGANRPAHRVAYELFVGPIPEGLFVCHTCDNRRCVNPQHLFVGTAQDNVRDMHTKGRFWGRRKLSDADIETAKRLRMAGWSQQKVAERLGVGQMAISRLERGVQSFARNPQSRAA